SFTTGTTGVMRSGELGTVTFGTSGFPVAPIDVLSVEGPGSSASLPSGVTFVSTSTGTATLFGTPALGSEGFYHLTLRAQSRAGVAFQAFTLIVASGPLFTSADTLGFRTGAAPTSFTITTSGAPAPSI